jgi:hypothetical protein
VPKPESKKDTPIVPERLPAPRPEPDKAKPTG